MTGHTDSLLLCYNEVAFVFDIMINDYFYVMYSIINSLELKNNLTYYKREVP